MADSKAKETVLKKLKIASKYKKLNATLNRANDKIGEFKLKENDKKEIAKIKNSLKK